MAAIRHERSFLATVALFLLLALAPGCFSACIDRRIEKKPSRSEVDGGTATCSTSAECGDAGVCVEGRCGPAVGCTSDSDCLCLLRCDSDTCSRVVTARDGEACTGVDGIPGMCVGRTCE